MSLEQKNIGLYDIVDYRDYPQELLDGALMSLRMVLPGVDLSAGQEMAVRQGLALWLHTKENPSFSNLSVAVANTREGKVNLFTISEIWVKLTQPLSLEMRKTVSKLGPGVLKAHEAYKERRRQEIRLGQKPEVVPGDPEFTGRMGHIGGTDPQIWLGDNSHRHQLGYIQRGAK